jgi:hypothetical protein
MKVMTWAGVLSLLLLCGGSSFAQVVPDDGAVGTRTGHHSDPVTSLTQNLMFSLCKGSTGVVAAECALVPGAQEVFGGLNETGQAWNSLSIELAGLNPNTDHTVGCDGGTLFTLNNCPITISGSTVTVTFLQGSGTGIGCFGVGNPDNGACLVNSVSAFANNLNKSNPVLPWDNLFGCSSPVPGSVCGSDDFLIFVGIDGKLFNTIPSQDFTLIANSPEIASTPEPSTLVLFGSAVLGMLLLGIKKGRLV